MVPSRPRKSGAVLRLVEPGRVRDPDAEVGQREVVDEAALIDDLLSEAPRRGAELFRYLAPVVHSALYRVLGASDRDFEDLVQITFEQIAESIYEGRYARGCRLTTWASIIAARAGLMAIRSRQRARRYSGAPLDELPPESDRAPVDVERLVAARRELVRVRDVLASMSEARAVVLVLHDAFGHDLREIAEELGISVAAAQSRLVRGRAEFLERDVAPEEEP
ncbi:MAG: RNA polymerase sigma factor [Myxococcales bacterium]|nr:RNA polymerase sigma factor [Myxococcales bacterium]